VIASPPRMIPVPNAVASLPGRQLPDRALAACNPYSPEPKAVVALLAVTCT
jgi:hypothetical protein